MNLFIIILLSILILISFVLYKQNKKREILSDDPNYVEPATEDSETDETV